MQLYTRKPDVIRMEKWDGGLDEPVVQELRDLGFVVTFQTSPMDMEKDWDEEGGKEIEVPARGRMAVVGKYNWDTWHFAPGRYILFRLVNKVTGKDVEWNDESLADDDNKIALGDRDPESLDSKYDLIG